ncbi:NADH-dependent dehydrogenase [Pontibacillus halophilus JSM 076056 = DSM 19796]|uniref:NADH-dependent dehydrogenase n=1 Tax=Pontibacillus halophilus JSM 076056 = DSM 19796 TaxID=1385510 RepID=A0A0A5I5P7_9BACI|nr:Gfo/Idh/MocA family oxidoreductase [Pontibacillus halophilus]KGX91152.1 NADH-dependent dehydrogenase [Pontibacillus halophilus JSM 076056 = DSM 19796]
MIRVALLSGWHVHAQEYAEEALKHPDLSVELIWDEDEQRGKEWAKELGVPFVADLDQVLQDANIEAVIVSSPTNAHPSLISAAAANGKHIFTEKVLAFTAEEAAQLLDEVKDNEVEFMISLPRLTADYYVAAQKAVDDGLLGELTMLRCRVAHDGSVSTDQHPSGWLPESFYDQELCGGGAFIDLGAHPIYLANRFGGVPSGVFGRLHDRTGRGVDDHATAIVEYESGLLATLETSFVSYGSPFQLELYGMEGTVLIEQDCVRMKSRSFGHDEWVTGTDQQALPTPMEQWVDAILNRRPSTITAEDAYWLTVVNEAAALSQREERRVPISGRMVSVPHS